MYQYLEKTLNLINPLNKKKIIFTVSPIPLNFTFTNKDIVISNKYSKSVLRAAVEKFIDEKNDCSYLINLKRFKNLNSLFN